MATILLVEDNDDVREMMAVALEMGGHQVLAASNGRAALDVLQHAPRPALILLDLMMPVMNGWEFRLALSRDPKFSSIPVVVVSAVTTEGAQGVADAEFMPKPIDIEQLLEVVDERAGRICGAS